MISDYKENHFYPIWTLIEIINNLLDITIIENTWLSIIHTLLVIVSSPITISVLIILYALHFIEFLMMNYGRGVGDIVKIDNHTIFLIKCIAVVTLIPVLIYAGPSLLVQFIKETREDRRRLAELKKVASASAEGMMDLDMTIVEEGGVPTEWELLNVMPFGDEVSPPDDDKLYDKMSPRRRMMNHKIDMTK
tara:strand:+ start:1065 stop:1640 length:576 start_codon:yes stop_codon:yes gene_type:complete